VSDLTFNGGAIGFTAGSQQYTARNLNFTNCIAAIEMIWDWGFNWKNIRVENCKVGINATRSGTTPGEDHPQSTGVSDSIRIVWTPLTFANSLSLC
jgi:hypothetical protein